jgi:poly-gamma-glutamate capsule biosynthesis protein CapA/YwtB (metallophosphatase superfamily)
MSTCLPPDRRLPGRAARRRQLWRRSAAASALLLGLAASVAAVAFARGSGPAEAARGVTPAHRAKARPAVPRNETVRVVAVGDLTFGWDASRPAGDGVSLLAGARRLLDGDVVLGNLETTLTTARGAKCGAASESCYAFRAPPSFTRGLTSAGFTVLNLANNHANDYGSEGQDATAAALHEAGLRTTGRPGEIAVLRAAGVRVAVVGFSTYPWSQDARDLAGAQALVRRAGRRADVVVVTGHLGAEGHEYAHVRRGRELFLAEDRGDPIAFSHAVVDAGADLVALHGPHVLRALEWYRSRLIAYSLGNFSAYGNLDVSGAGGVSAVLRATLRADGTWVRGRLAPIRLAGRGTPEDDPDAAAVRVVRQLSHEDVGERAPRLTPTGAILPPKA